MDIKMSQDKKMTKEDYRGAIVKIIKACTEDDMCRFVDTSDSIALMSLLMKATKELYLLDNDLPL